MSRRLARFLVVAIATTVGLAAGQQPPPAFPREGATKILENERVIVWDVQLQKGQRAAMHTHPYDIVSVTLTPGGHQDNGADGVTEERMFKTGDVRFTPRGRTHFEIGLTDPPRRAIVTELKPLAPGGAPLASRYPRAVPGKRPGSRRRRSKSGPAALDRHRIQVGYRAATRTSQRLSSRPEDPQLEVDDDSGFVAHPAPVPRRALRTRLAGRG